MYVAVHPSCDRVYVANRTEEGLVSEFAVDGTEGSLDRRADRSSEGVGPCYVSVDTEGAYAFVANYGGGTVAMYPLDAAGGLGPACDVVVHRGSGPAPDRQDAPHPHSAVVGPEGEYLYVPDLGTDRIETYRIDRASDRLEPADPPGVALRPETGPRHLAFGPDGERAYLVGELDSTLTMLSRATTTGALAVDGRASTLPDDASDGDNAPADVAVHKDGWVYVSNRGHQSITAFKRTAEGLRTLGHTPTGGANPRDIALDPTGRFLLVENRDGYSITSFAVGADGHLDERGRWEVPKPTCLAFVRRD